MAASLDTSPTPRSNSADAARPLRIRRARLTAAVVLTALLVPACGGGSPSAGSPTSDTTAPAATHTSPDQDLTDAAGIHVALQQAYESFDPAEADATLQRALSVERVLTLSEAKESGIEEALGGPEEAAAAFAALDAQYAALGAELSTPVQFGLVRQPSAGSGVAQGLVGGVIVVGLGSEAAVDASQDGTTGTSSRDGVTITVTDDLVILDVDTTYMAEGLTSRLKTHTEFNPCPDADGVIRLQAKVDTTTTTESGESQSAVLDVDVVVQLNDDAGVSGTDDTFRMQRSGLTGGSWWDVTVTGGVSGTNAQVNDFNWFTSEIQDRDETASLATILGQLIKKFMMDAAKKAYESGRCIELKVTADPGPSGLDPLQTSTITASPTVKKDGQPAGGTVKAELTAGEERVEPSGTKEQADATFTFTAPDDIDRTGTVHFESRSKRGVGLADLTLDTKQDCIVGTWTLDAESMTAILDPMAQAHGGSMRAAGTSTATFTEDGKVVYSLDGLSMITEVPNGSMTAIYSGSDTGTWERTSDESYVITTMQMGTSVNATVSAGGMTMNVPATYSAMLQPDVAMACKDDTITVSTPQGAITLTRAE